MNTIRITIPGTPLAKKRHRSTKHGHYYNAQSGEEAAIRWDIKSQISSHIPFSGPCRFSVRAIFPRPKNHFGTGRNANKLKVSAPKFHTVKPDTDNIAKIYADCCNDIVFKDDKQIVLLVITKRYGNNPRVEIEVNELGG